MEIRDYEDVWLAQSHRWDVVEPGLGFHMLPTGLPTSINTGQMKDMLALEGTSNPIQLALLFADEEISFRKVKQLA